MITVVKDADAVKEISFGKNGIIEGKHDGFDYSRNEHY